MVSVLLPEVIFRWMIILERKRAAYLLKDQNNTRTCTWEYFAGQLWALVRLDILMKPMSRILYVYKMYNIHVFQSQFDV